MIKEININWSKTKQNIERIINKYNLYILSVNTPENIETSMILNLLNIEDLNNEYIKLDINDLKKRLKFINYVRFSYTKLTTEEKKIIYWTYFDKENNYDDRFIANNLGFSLGYYYVKKKEALTRFAYSLGVEVTND